MLSWLSAHLFVFADCCCGQVYRKIKPAAHRAVDIEGLGREGYRNRTRQQRTQLMLPPEPHDRRNFLMRWPSGLALQVPSLNSLLNR